MRGPLFVLVIGRSLPHADLFFANITCNTLSFTYQIHEKDNQHNSTSR